MTGLVTAADLVGLFDGSRASWTECVFVSAVRGRAETTVADALVVRFDVFASLAGSLPAFPSVAVGSAC